MRKALVMLGVLSDSDMDWLSQAGERRRIAAGGLLISEGKAIDTMYILLDGQMSVRVHETEVAQLSSGEILGELSLIDARPASATVTALSDAVILALGHDRLRRKLQTDTGFGSRFYQALAIFLADRLRSSVRRLGYGPGALAQDEELEDELDVSILENLHLAGAKFDKLLKDVMKGA